MTIYYSVIRYIDAVNGDDSNSGETWESAYKTLEYALNRPGDTFFIAPGVYWLLQEGKSALRKYIALVGLGGVQIKSISPAASLRFQNISNILLHNLVLEKWALTTEFSLGTAGILKICNCDLHEHSLGMMGTGSLRRCYLSLLGCRLPLPLEDVFDASWEVWDSTEPLPSLFFRPPDATQTGGRFNSGTAALAYTTMTEGEAPYGFLKGGITEIIMPYQIQAASWGEMFQGPAVGRVTGAFTPWELNHVPDPSIRRRFSLWEGDPSQSSTEFEFIDDQGIYLRRGESGARCLSPVAYYPYGIVIGKIKLDAVEMSYHNVGQVIDAEPEHNIRMVEVRTSDTPFKQTDILPGWQVVERNAELLPPITGKYVQYRLTFQMEAELYHGPLTTDYVDFDTSLNAITAYYPTGKSGNLPANLHPVIPSHIDGIPVLNIAEDAFRAKGLTGVTFKEGIQKIWKGAFMDNAITELSLPNSLGPFPNGLTTQDMSGTNFGTEGPFRGNAIHSLNLPEGISLAPYTFANNMLTSVELPMVCGAHWASLFRDNPLTSIHFKEPSQITTLASVLSNHSELTEIVLPTSLTQISDTAFLCPLRKIVIPADVLISLSGDLGTIAGFGAVYAANGKAAGTYEYDEVSETWSKTS